MERTFTPQTERVTNPPMPTKDTLGHLQAKLKLNSFTEFAPVKGLVLGYMGNTAQIPADEITFATLCNDAIGKKYPEQLIKRCQVAQNNVAQRLMDMGIEVLRPAEIDHTRKYELEGITIHGGMQTFSPRDILFYYHDSVYECPTVQSSRVHETESMDWFLEQQRENGAKWYDSYKIYYGKNAPLFDAANLQKIGFDIIFLISMSGHVEGWEMFNNIMQKKIQRKSPRSSFV